MKARNIIMFCPNCGNNLPDGTKFCPSCGTQTAARQNNSDNAQHQNPNAQNFRYQNPNFNAVPRAPIARRSVGVAIILSIITCGIYGIYWLISLANELNTASGRYSDTSGGMVFLLTLVTCGIYGWFWLYKAGEKVDIIKSNRGVPSSGTGILYIVLSLFGLSIIDYALIQSELNNVATIG